ncbi:hypothetical protein H0H93_004513 [Arthromyces matolae]|nr:hypothetical protein H0H93_004513 [Arthromyces matolae]
MAPSDSEDETPEELEFDVDDDPEAEGDDEPTEVGADDVTEADDESASDDSDDGSEEEDDEDDNEFEAMVEAAAMDVDHVEVTTEVVDKNSPSPPPTEIVSSPKAPSTALSSEQLRKNALIAPIGNQVPLGSYTVEAICALPHPVPTHALASSLCMTHLLTGSDDGYIRDYDIFASVNSKIFLTAPQRHHSGVVEGIMKAGQLRYWWENPALPDPSKLGTISGMAESVELPASSPVYSLAMHSDALWTLAGTDSGHINLFTTRHDPGRVFCAMTGHRGPVSAMSISHDEKGFFSAGWDGEAIHWDLNNGQRVRTFTAHGAQLAAIAVRPLVSGFSGTSPADEMMSQISDQGMDMPENNALYRLGEIKDGAPVKEPPDADAKSDASFDPLFDDEPEDNQGASHGGASNSHSKTQGLIPPPKNAPPLLDSTFYSTFSPDLLMTASIDGQVILWDKRVDTPGTGVGRLWMSEKTPPWPVGLLTEVRYMRGDVTVPWTYGMFDCLDVLVYAARHDFSKLSEIR